MVRLASSAQRARKRSRMQGIDQHIAGTVRRRRPQREIRQIGEIPDAP